MPICRSWMAVGRWSPRTTRWRATPSLWLIAVLAVAQGVAAAADAERMVKDQARAACDALVRGDLEKFIGWTHPKLVQAMGGREQLLAILKDGQRDLARQGIQLVSASIQPPVELARGGSQRFAVVPYDLEMTVPDGRVLSRTWLLGVSADDGQTWTFVDGGNLNRDSVRRLFPEFPAGLAIPMKRPARVEKNGS